MRKIFRIILALLFTLFYLNTKAVAEIPYFVDFKYILNESTAGKKAQNFLKNKLENGLKNLKEKEKKIQEEEISLSDLKNNIDPASIIYLLLDSSKISTFNFNKEEGETKEKYQARFFADKEDILVNDISNQKFFSFSENNNDLVFLIDKEYYEKIYNILCINYDSISSFC